MCDNEPSPGSLVLGLPVHDGAVHVVPISPGREDEEQRREAEEDARQSGDRALEALGESDGDNTKERRKLGPTVSRVLVKICGPVVYCGGCCCTLARRAHNAARNYDSMLCD